MKKVQAKVRCKPHRFGQWRVPEDVVLKDSGVVSDEDAPFYRIDDCVKLPEFVLGSNNPEDT